MYALLDPCSQGTFIVESALDSLGVKDVFFFNFTVKTLNGDQSMISGKVKGLVVTKGDSGGQEVKIKLPPTYTQSELLFDSEDIISRDELLKWPHLHRLLKEIPVFESCIPFGLLIGANCTKALKPVEVLPSVANSPYAVRMRLGWCVIGAEGDASSTTMKCKFIKTDCPDQHEIHDIQMMEAPQHGRSVTTSSRNQQVKHAWSPVCSQ